MARQRVVFFGSGPVAAAALKLLSKHCDIEAVVTKPTTAKEMAAALPNTPIHEVSSKQELDQLISSNPFASSLAVLIDFGIIVSQQVIDYFEKGIINSHFSLLPQWRGADPITFSLLSGQQETGVSLMMLTAGMDEGPILSVGKLPIDSQNNQELTDQLIELSDALLKEGIPAYLDDMVAPRQQDSVAEMLGIDPVPSYSRKLTKADGVIDWKKSAVQLEREIRAFSGWPRSRAKLSDKDVIITEAHVTENDGQPGDIYATKDSLVVTCGEQALSIDKLQPAGKKEMPIRAFLAGYQV